MLMISKQIIECFKAGGKLLICGNGGSASMALHMAGEFVCSFEHNRKALPAIALVDNPSVMTAWGNDKDFDDVFARQVQALGKPGDILIALSTSGKSKNVIAAMEEAHKIGMGVIDFPRTTIGKTRTAKIQENQLVMMHQVCREVELAFI